MSLEKFQKYLGDVKLTNGQAKFVEEFFLGKNLFLSGPAGTGKSFIVNKLCNFLDAEGIFVARTATTGVAALNVGGSTLHSFFGMGLAQEDVTTLIQTKVKKNKRAVSRIRMTKILVIDEISMCGANLLDKVDLISKYFRYNTDSFGQMQILLLGDFLQLPNIINRGEIDSFAFSSDAWKEAKIKTINLTEPVRQSDAKFIELLNNIRIGKLDDLSLLYSRVNAKLNLPQDVKATKLFAKNVDVNNFNLKSLSKLPGEEMVYHSCDFGTDFQKNFLDKSCPAPKILNLKIGAAVMLVYNLDVENSLVNGSIGVVTKFEGRTPVVRFRDGCEQRIDPVKWEIKEKSINSEGKITYKISAWREQYPLKLSWALSCHKSQGSTLNYVDVSLNEIFSCGQAYVALSRCKDIESLTLKPFDPSVFKVNQECLDFYLNLEETRL